MPVVASDEDGGDDGEQARDVVEAEQRSAYSAPRRKAV